MLPNEIIGSLKSLTQKHGVKISEIERDCLISKNSLASVITQKRAFPMKHKERLQEYCKAKEVAILLGKSTRTIPPMPNTDIALGGIPDPCRGVKDTLRAANKRIDELEEELRVFLGQNKPLPTPKPEKLPNAPKKEDKGGKEAENGLKIEYDGTPLTEKEIEGVALAAKNFVPAEQPPEGLTEIQLMVWKNEQKKKSKAKKPPITDFGTAQQENKDPF